MGSVWRVNLFILLMACATGCSSRIIPPPQPAAPQTVYVADYGRHSSILLPSGAGCLVEYSFGDWEYYALNKWRWYIGATALVYSESSGLGRRFLPNVADAEALRQLIDSKRVLELRVEQAKVADLLDELDGRYNERINTLVFNDYNRQYFVKDEARYGLLHTCNHATAAWLEKLGCRVKGFAVLSNFRVDEPAALTKSPAQPSPGGRALPVAPAQTGG